MPSLCLQYTNVTLSLLHRRDAWISRGQKQLCADQALPPWPAR